MMVSQYLCGPYIKVTFMFRGQLQCQRKALLSPGEDQGNSLTACCRVNTSRATGDPVLLLTNPARSSGPYGSTFVKPLVFSSGHSDSHRQNKPYCLTSRMDQFIIRLTYRACSFLWARNWEQGLLTRVGCPRKITISMYYLHQSTADL